MVHPFASKVTLTKVGIKGGKVIANASPLEWTLNICAPVEILAREVLSGLPFESAMWRVGHSKGVQFGRKGIVFVAVKPAVVAVVRVGREEKRYNSVCRAKGLVRALKAAAIPGLPASKSRPAIGGDVIDVLQQALYAHGDVRPAQRLVVGKELLALVVKGRRVCFGQHVLGDDATGANAHDQRPVRCCHFRP